MNNWVSYKNGNYQVQLNLKNGTKIRLIEGNKPVADTIESMDLKITNMCDVGCPMCHENSLPTGAHADLFAPSFLDTLHPYTELAIGGGNPLAHPDLYKFLCLCKERKFVPSMTVNQKHFMEQFEFLKQLRDEGLIYGLGVSLIDANAEFIDMCKEYGPNLVIHVINGIVSTAELFKLAHKQLKVLILGYKVFRRGGKLYCKDKVKIEEAKKTLKSLLPVMLKTKWFDVVSFDNLALKQLDVKSILSEKEWQQFYMGDDGLEGEQTSATMFVDLVEREFAKNSCSKERYPLMNTVEDMYNYLRGKYEDIIQTV